jgi:hypothetical protein
MSGNVPGWMPGATIKDDTPPCACCGHRADSTSTPVSAQSGVAGGGAAGAVVTPRWIRLIPRRPCPAWFITIRSWHLSQPSRSQSPSGRRMNSRRTRIHQTEAGSAASSVKPLMLRLTPQTRRSKCWRTCSPDDKLARFCRCPDVTNSGHQSLFPQFTKVVTNRR